MRVKRSIFGILGVFAVMVAVVFAAGSAQAAVPSNHTAGGHVLTALSAPSGALSTSPQAVTAQTPAAFAAPVSDIDPLLCCSRIENRSQYSITAYKDWTCDWGGTASSSTGCFGGSSRGVSPGSTTPYFEDWDVLRIDGGWCYKVYFTTGVSAFTKFYNQSGLGHRYVKVDDASTGYVQAQRYGSCPA
ncbi:hypothetical protein [Streptomyces sp. NPDC004783]|uniref:hypothetical protein n=1 Tax=Streptomyces sp. NPDC004783 TaxID=3154459 RepID=UPI0033BBE64C